VNGKHTTKEVYPHQIAFNVLPHVDSFLPSGYTKEEMKMENEGRKIMHHPAFRASVTCVRVPVYRAHSIAVNAEFDKPVTVESARAVLSKAPGLQVIDEPSKICIRFRSIRLSSTIVRSAACAAIAHWIMAWPFGSLAINSSKERPSMPFKLLRS